MKTQIRRLAFALALIASACGSLTDKSYAHDLPADRFVCPFVDTEWIDSPANCSATVPIATAEIEIQRNSAKPNRIQTCVRQIGLDLNTMLRKIGIWWTSSALAISQFADALPRLQQYSDPCEIEKIAGSQSRVALPDDGLPPTPHSSWTIVDDLTAEEFVNDDLGNPFVPVFELTALEAPAQLFVSLPADGCPPEPIRQSDRDVSDIHSEETVSLQPCTPPGHYVCLANRTQDRLECEEYRPYDLEDHDSHWLSGIGQSWNWRKRLSAPLSKYLPSTLPLDSSLDTAQSLNDRDPEFACEEEFAKAVPTLSSVDKTENTQWTCPDEQINSSEQAVVENAIEQVRGEPTAYLAMACEFVEDLNCICQAECCDMQCMYVAGQQLAMAINQSTQRTGAWFEFVTSNLVAPDTLPPTQFLLPMFAMVSTSDGATVIVPADLAHQWCAEANALSQDCPPARNAFVDAMRDRTQRLIDSTHQWIDWTITTAIFSIDQLCELHETLVANRETPSVR